MLKTPVLILIFNRPEHTSRMMEAIRSAKPKRIFIAADGPRADRPKEKDLCEQTRNLVLNAIDWDCKIQTLFRDENLGCGLAVSQGIDWFFEEVEEGIILEDDIVPDPSFFPFCEELLEKYRDNDQVALIGGNNNITLNEEESLDGASYFFSAYNAIWGWASWRRVWKNYTYDIDPIQELKISQNLRDFYGFSAPEINYWKYIFKQSLSGAFDTWDYQFTFSIWGAKQYGIVPTKNMILNIGFDQNSTHTGDDERFNSMKVSSIGELSHPPKIDVQRGLDAEISKFIFNIDLNDKSSYWRYILKPKIKRIIKSWS